MKLITKNLTGYLENGNRYRVLLQDKRCPIIPTNRIISVIQEEYLEEYGEWFYNNSACSSYHSKEQYKDTLKEALIRAELEFKIDLLKSEMKIAV